jgi:hypothetical protein
MSRIERALEIDCVVDAIDAIVRVAIVNAARLRRKSTLAGRWTR